MELERLCGTLADLPSDAPELRASRYAGGVSSKPEAATISSRAVPMCVRSIRAGSITARMTANYHSAGTLRILRLASKSSRRKFCKRLRQEGVL